MKRGKRVQEGVMHVAFRGNAKFAVFYDDEDKTTLLKFLQIALYENNSTLYEFCIMTNHCHLMLQTECLTKLMTVFLREYSRWHNKKYKLSEKLFGTPFLSAPQYTENHMIDKCAYILNNPVSAGICTDPLVYEWSSAKFHFNYEGLDSLYLHDVISVDTSICDHRYKNLEEFMSYVTTFHDDDNECDIFAQKRITYAELMETATAYLKTKYNIETFSSLTLEQIREFAQYLHKTTKCTAGQLASLFHDSRYRIIKILKK